MRTDEPRTVALGQWNAARSNLYHWPSQHDANVVRKHQDIVKNVKGFSKASQHLLKRQGKKIKRYGAVTLERFGGNPDNKFKMICQDRMIFGNFSVNSEPISINFSKAISI